MDKNQSHHSNIEEHGEGHEKFIEVAVLTTSGSYPANGFEWAPLHQKVEIALAKAAKALHLTDTTGWIATVDKRTIDPQRNYEENALSGKVEIDWGPSEGGGGNA